MNPIIDAHIHLDLYEESFRKQMLSELDQNSIIHLIAVSNDLNSCLKNLTWSMQEQRIKPALGFHPEQSLPSKEEAEKIADLIRRYEKHIVAIGEVGLPYYTRQDHPEIHVPPYLDLLEHFLRLANELDKPVVLHAIYEDADLVCDLLEKHQINHAHFHWFKGSPSTIKRMINNRFFISVTPDCLYEEEIHDLIKQYPLDLIMVETDGPWPFDGPFEHLATHPKMIHDSVRKISELKNQAIETVYDLLYKNTVKFYRLNRNE
ncbi:TatD family hydrolase [Halobacillus sp. BBL2006]|uniref:TatD family hydrolase n=1 Tax=Halobacillus sp. BBL2006 TaxID=1543706 RepID=UPI00054310B3|nr:TatD family hydrolase [Halobacillus sp. BBL2006]KHE68168.1 DNAase [Halobacillus sp. BBL2006]